MQGSDGIVQFGKHDHMVGIIGTRLMLKVSRNHISGPQLLEVFLHMGPDLLALCPLEVGQDTLGPASNI